jgi:hypothetical protein
MGKVKDYIEINRHDPLHFGINSNPFDDDEYLKDIKSLLIYSEKQINGAENLDSAIALVLKASDKFWSTNSDQIQETSPGRNRSLIDIWRHLIYFEKYKDISPIEVMHALYNLSHDHTSLMCPTVRRRVFRLRPIGAGNYFSLMFQNRDEFGLLREDWKNYEDEI